MHTSLTMLCGVFILASNICFAEPTSQGKGGSAARHQLGRTPPSPSANPQLPARSGISPRLDQIQPNREPASPGGPPTEREKENLPVPLPERHGRAPGSALSATGPSPALPLSARVVGKFDGVRQGVNYRPRLGISPPDPNGSVDSKWYVQWVNNVYTIVDKINGTVRVKPTSGNSIWNGFGGNCELDNDGDPIVVYDRAARRWLMTQFATQPKTKNPHYSECIVISETGDPGGRYYLFEYEFKQFNDYPKFGLWRDGYYVTFNMFTNADRPEWIGARVCAFDRDKMLSTDEGIRKAASMKCFDPKDENHRSVGGVLPADVDGSNPPPEGSPEYVIGFGDNQLRIWRIKMNWADINNSAISGPTLLKVDGFQPAACRNPRSECVPQKDTPALLESLPDRMMYRLVYRNFGDRESILANHTVKAGSTYGIRWYELSRPITAAPGTEFVIQQQQTFAPDDSYRWIGSIAADKFGNVLLTYNVSSHNSYPSLRFAGREAGAPPSVLSTEGILAEGKRSTAGHRWGDYGSISLDPDDDCTFWVTGEYLGDYPLERIEIARSDRDLRHRSSASAAPLSALSGRPEGLLAANVVTGYYWDTVIESIRFPECK